MNSDYKCAELVLVVLLSTSFRLAWLKLQLSLFRKWQNDYVTECGNESSFKKKNNKVHLHSRSMHNSNMRL